MLYSRNREFHICEFVEYKPAEDGYREVMIVLFEDKYYGINPNDVYKLDEEIKYPKGAIYYGTI